LGKSWFEMAGLKLHVGIVAALLILRAVPAVAGADSAAQQLYESHCAFCHGMAGKGDGVAGGALNPPPTDFTTREFWKTRTNDQLRDAIMNGKPGTSMVPFRNTLKPDQVETLVVYLRAFAPK
jgi:high-affinity iron transporter